MGLRYCHTCAVRRVWKVTSNCRYIYYLPETTQDVISREVNTEVLKPVMVGLLEIELKKTRILK